jgi:glycosyltransferase involved in cell wall biosynthesis
VSKVGYDAKQVVTTYEGVDDSFYSHSRTESPEDVSEPYLLHISTASDINVFRKNMTTIVKALGLLRRRLNQDLKLVVVGNGWEEQFARSTDLPTNPDGIKFSGFVSKERLIQLYDHASCYIFPSLYEGFGIPNVEAMARGTPVVTTGKYGTKDIVDGAGMLIEDPLDATELANTIETVLTDEARTANLVDHGRDRAERFRWPKHVACVEDIYTAVS